MKSRRPVNSDVRSHTASTNVQPMTGREFKTLWERDDEPLVTFAPEHLQKVNLAFEARDFLLTAGLPDSAAPFLSFKTPKQGHLPTVAEQWGLNSDYPTYWVIGANGSGDPVCLDDSENGRIVYLNHDNDFASVFINTSISHLATALLHYRAMVRSTQKQNGEMALLDDGIPLSLLNAFVGAMQENDPPALRADTFWGDEIQRLRLA